MTKLVWGTPGERFFETGIERGVLYIDGVGVPWNGLASVQEKSSGGEITPYYVDGQKYAQSMATEEFDATVQAYSRPDEFAACEGLLVIAPGLEATKQPHKVFNFTYKTLVGNDSDGTAHGYKIHLVYNAYASSPDRDNNSLKESTDPILFSWDVTALPKAYSGIRATAHFVVDSRTADPQSLITLEEKLYGTAEEDAYLPDLPEILTLLTANTFFTVTDNGDGTVTMTGADTWFSAIDDTTEQITAPSIVVIDADSFTIHSV